MVSFDFITNDELRSSLEGDYQEMAKSLDAKAFKAVHVLAGSIIEALLVDYLIAVGYKKGDPLKMDLASIIQACRDDVKVISSRAADLSTVIRSYRNLIHPARLLRLHDKVDENSATVSYTLVKMIVEEVMASRAKTYGYTASQIVNKIFQDSSVNPVLLDILQQTNKVELVKLLSLIPEVYMTTYDPIVADEEDWRLKTLVEAFHTIFDMVDDTFKCYVAKRFIDLIKNDNTYKIHVYGDNFFRASHINFLDESEKSFVLKYIKGHMERYIGENNQTLIGIGSWLDEYEIHEFTSLVVKKRRYSIIAREYFDMSSIIAQACITLLKNFVRTNKPNNIKFASEIEDLIEDLSFGPDDIPF